MDALTLVFPGQGSQFPGMARDFHDAYAVARAAFAEASDALGEDITQICFESDQRLNLTEFTQPCILTAEIAMLRVLTEEFGLRGDRFAGHSLGEYAALVAAGVMPLSAAVQICRRRGALMQEAVPVGQGAMAALLMDDIDASGVAGTIAAAGVEIANRNSPQQLVVSGGRDAVYHLLDTLEEKYPDMTVVPLNVSAPFHSALMQGIETTFADFLKQFQSQFDLARGERVFSNFTGELHTKENLLENLTRQISGTVRWTENMRAIVEHGGAILEVGPGCPLQKFFAKIERTITAIPDLATMQEQRPFLENLRPPAPEPEAEAEPESVAQIPQPADPVQESSGEREIRAETLGDAAFRADHGVRYAYVAGSMVHGIGSEEIVIRMARAGLLAYFGTGGLGLKRIESAIQKIQNELPADAPYGMNLLSNLNQPEMEDQTVDLLLRYGIRRVEASAYTLVTPALVRYRLSGISENPDGSVQLPNRIMAKLSRPEVAETFLAPPPERLVRQLSERGVITADEARLATRIPMADDICAEADSGGHTDGGVMTALLPAMMVMRDEAMRTFSYDKRIRVGAAGGLGTPASIAAALVMGADFILTGSVNQCTVEAGTSDTVKDLLEALDIQDFATAPAGDMFEIGARVQVVRRGTFFPVRANKLYELYLRYDSLEDLQKADPTTYAMLERDYFKKSITDIWQETQEYYRSRGDTSQLDRAERSAKHRMALVFRWYFGRTMRLSREGDPELKIDFQIHSGPALGSFNRWFKNTPLEKWRNRHVDQVAEALMDGAARELNRRFAQLQADSIAARELATR